MKSTFHQFWTTNTPRIHAHIFLYALYWLWYYEPKDILGKVYFSKFIPGHLNGKCEIILLLYY